jgi:predicted  nucleic acid-binding Zn-ribbon protein
MATTLQLLQELHKIDLELSDIAREMAARPAAVAAAEQELAARETERTELLAQARSTQVDADRSGVEIKSLEEKIGKYQMQLNIIKTQKEYDVIRSEIAGCQKQISDFETAALEAYEKAETLTKRARGLDPVIAAKKKELEAARSVLADQLADLEHRKEKASRARAEAVKPIDAEDLRRYDNAQEKYPGAGMSRVDNGKCVACNMKIPPQVFNLVLIGDPPQQCRSCGRMLYAEKS